ncbi:hypothetical protein IX293_001726 [Fusobacterium necrophorum]|nr:hypothetical protein [Fusobacterium necrophorum]MBR8823456.1 hypothetical protein [Fusobacterium necrophorum]
MSNTVKKLELFFIIVFYKLFLEENYYIIVKNIVSYEKMTYEYNNFLYILSWCIIIVFYKLIFRIYLKFLNAKIEGLIFFNLIFIAFIPFLAMLPFSGFHSKFILYSVFFYFFLFNVIRIKNIDLKKRKSLRINKKNCRLYFITFNLFIFFIVFYVSSKVSFRILINFSEVYKYRQIDLKLYKTIDYILGSLKIICPILLLHFLIRKNILKVMFIILEILLLYGIYGEKTIIFLLAITIGIYLFLNTRTLKIYPYGFLSIVVLAFYEFKILQSFYVNNFIIRRVFFFTNKIQEAYFTHFVIEKMKNLETTYELSHLMAGLYFDDFNMGINSGLVSDAVSNFGKLGILLYPLAILLLMKILSFFTQGIDIRIKFLLGLYVSILLVSTFLKTMLLSHGIFLIIILLFLVKNLTEKREWQQLL